MFRSIIATAFFSLVSDLSSRLASALVLIAITRRLGESAAGVYTLSTNYVLLTSALAFWGLDQLLIRDVAQHRSQAAEYFVHFFLIRLLLSFALWLALTILLLGMHPYQPETNWFIALAGGTIVGASVSNLGQSLLIAYERVWPASLVSVATGILQILGSLAILSSGRGMRPIALVLVLSSLLQAVVLTGIATRTLRLRGFRLDASFIRREMGDGFPFVPILVFIALETQLGGILLSLFHNEAVVGRYGMANMVVTALALLSQAVRVGIFPVMARLRREDPPSFGRLYARSWKTLSAGSLPAVVLLILLSEPILRLIYGSAPAEAVATLQFLAPTLVFYFLNTPNVRLMILDGRQGTLVTWYVVSTAVHVIVALVLIPRYGAPAVGLARDLSMGTFFVLNSVYVERRVLAAHPWRLVWRPVVATGSMAFFVFVGVPGWPFWARGAAGLALYGVILGLLTAIRMREDRRIVPKSPGSSVAEGPPDEDQP